MKIIASPKTNVIYQAEKPRLASAVLSQIKLIKRKNDLQNFETNLGYILRNSLERVAYDAYLQACKHIEVVPEVSVGLKLRRQARARSLEAAQLITQSTGKAFGFIKAMTEDYAISSQRADAIAVNELSLQFFGGTVFGWGLDPTARKTWELSDWHDRDDICDDNYDEGPININEPFQSGDFIPPAHINCDCELGLVRVRVKKTIFGAYDAYTFPNFGRHAA